MSTHFIIYKTTNLINGKFYIGAHQTKDLDDGYLGSGTLLKLAVKKYGEESFQRTIIYNASSEDEMYLKEKELVNLEVTSNSQSYNIKEGGIGGWSHITDNFGRSLGGKRAIQKLNQNMVALDLIDSEFKERRNQQRIDALKLATLAALSDQAKSKRRQSMKGKMPHSKGKFWVSNDDLSISKMVMGDIIEDGWYRGRRY